MRMRIPLVAVLALFVAVSCDQQLVEPADEAAVETPAFNYSNNDGWLANGKIFRHAHDEFIWLAWDDKRELVALFSTFTGGFCGLGADLEPVDAQHVYDNPDLTDEISHLFEQGDVWAELYDWSGLWNQFDCANYTPARFMGEGEVRIVSTDNDVFAFFGGHDRNNAFGLNGSGNLELVGGGTTNINYVFRQTWNPDKGNFSFVEKMNISNDLR